MMGKVYLIGAGPGDPELLTMKAARLLASANVVLHDALVSDAVLAMISPAAEIINVGKRAGHKLLTQDEINALLVSYGRTRPTVVRLKGGDPSIFGRAGEEIEALRATHRFSAAPGKKSKRFAKLESSMKLFRASAPPWEPRRRRESRSPIAAWRRKFC